MLPGLGAPLIAAGRRTPVDLVFCASGTDTANKTSYSFSSVSIGEPDTNRRLVICAFVDNPGGSNPLDVSACTAAGVATTRVASVTSAFSGCGGAIFITNSDVTTGLTGTISFTTGATADNLMYAVYAVYGLSNATVDDTIAITENDPSEPIDVTANGILIALCGSNSTSGFAWTNIDKDADLTQCSFASQIVSATETRTVSCSVSTTDGDIMLAAAWNP